MRKYQKGFSEIILLLIITLLIGGVGFFIYQNRQPRQDITETQSMTSQDAEWKTYVNTKYGYQFNFPPEYEDINLECGSAEFENDFVSLLGCDSLVIQIEPIQTTELEPMKWWSDQSIEAYTNKPASCFSYQSTNTIKSLYDEDKTVVSFDNDVLKLNNFYSQDSTCLEPPEVQILFVAHKGNILKITYDWASMSEQILSTFKLLE